MACDRPVSGQHRPDARERTVEPAQLAGRPRGTRVIEWTVFGGGHTWPGTPVPSGYAEPVSLEFDAAEEICRFARPLLIPAKERRL
jgi:polyhydroxybutyrate depolymerase